MGNYTYEIDTEHNIYPNLIIEKVLRDDELAYWRVQAKSGYVFYDANAEDTDYYATILILNPMFDWGNFSLVAVLRDSVDGENKD